MAEFTIEELRALLRQCGGEDEDVDLEADILDIPFAELGYDSLAILEVGAQVERQYGVEVSDTAVDEMRTPRQALVYVNSRLLAA